jgi:hypothetical protein
MAKINVVKAAKKPQGDCVRCHQPIKVDQSYEWVRANRYARKYKKHASCPPFLTSERISDMTLAELYDARDNATSAVESWGEKRMDPPDTGELDDILSDLADTAGSARDEWQERFDNIPEQLQTGPVAEGLQEKIDAADSYESELQSVTFEDFQDDIGLEEAGEEEETPEEREERLNIWIEDQREMAQSAIDSLEI